MPYPRSSALLALCALPTFAWADEPLTGHATVENGRVTVYNDSTVELTSVVAIADTGQICTLGVVHPHDQAGMNLANCSGPPASGAIQFFQVASQQGGFTAPVLTAARPASGGSSSGGSSSTASSTPAAPAEGGSIKIHTSMSGGFGPARRLSVFNDGAAPISGCRVTVNGLYGYDMKTVAAGADEGIMMVRFKDSAGNAFTSNAQVNTVKVACAQGTATSTPK